MRFDPAVLRPEPHLRRRVLGWLEAALEAVDPARAVGRTLRHRGGLLQAGQVAIDLTGVDRIVLVAFGKAAPAMAAAAAEVLGERLAGGVVVASQRAELPDPFELHVGGHPVPDAGSLEGARRALRLLEGLDEGDLALILVSGGGSALLELPAEGLQLADLARTTEVLLGAGADIGRLNTVRKHISAIKGGRLALAAAPARLLTLVLSDVVGSPLEVVASGPTVPDPTTYGDALQALAELGVTADVPGPVLRHLERGVAGDLTETPATGLPPQEVVVVADGATAAEGVRRRASGEGVSVRVVTAELAGEAREAAGRCLAEAGPEDLAVFTGETTVTVRGSGRGGRNQEAALAAALELHGRTGLLFAALATDGVDGPTEAAGGLVDGTTVARGKSLGLSARRHLEQNDSGPYLEAVDDRLVTGPTGTNVGDVWLVWRSER